MLTGAHHVDQFGVPAFVDQLPGRRVDHQDLHRRHAPDLFHQTRQQYLADDRLEVERQRLPRQVTRFGREQVQDTGHRRGRPRGVDRAEDQVPRLGRLQRRLERLAVAHLPDQHHVGVFAHQVLQRRLERRHVDAHLALADQGLLVRVDVLDRVFDRHHVTGAGPVDVLDHGRDGGGLARAGNARNQHQPRVQFGDIVDLRGKGQLLEAHDLPRDAPDGDADVASLAEDVDPEAVAPFQLLRHVDAAELLEERRLLVGEYLTDHLGDLVPAQRRALDRADGRLQSDVRHGAGLQVQVAALLLAQRLEVLVELGGLPVALAVLVVLVNRLNVCHILVLQTALRPRVGARLRPGRPHRRITLPLYGFSRQAQEQIARNRIPQTHLLLRPAGLCLPMPIACGGDASTLPLDRNGNRR